MTNQWSTQIASDVVRDGLGVELLSASGEVVAEVFRCDMNHAVTVTTFGNDVPYNEVARLVSLARCELGPTYEDGTAIEWAELT